MMKGVTVRILALAMFLSATAASAQTATLDARTAQSIVTGCAAHATAKQQSHSIVVVDLGGDPVAALRMDRNGSGTFDFAMQKAAAVAAWGFPTSGMEEGAKEVPGFARAPHVVTVPGGVPVWSADGKTRLGGVGVSGEAPADDAACAEAGIRAAGLRSSRVR
jgi:glc operon protein GlcG